MIYNRKNVVAAPKVFRHTQGGCGRRDRNQSGHENLSMTVLFLLLVGCLAVPHQPQSRPTIQHRTVVIPVGVAAKAGAYFEIRFGLFGKAVKCEVDRLRQKTAPRSRLRQSCECLILIAVVAT